MARVNTDTLGIRKLKSTWMGEFNWDDNNIYYCGQESLRRNGVPIMVNKRVWTAVLGCNLNALFKDKSFNTEVEWFYADLQDLLKLTPPKDVFFIIGYWNGKVGGQEVLGVTGKVGLRVQNEAGQRLIEFCQENALVISNTLFQQHKRRFCIWTSPDGQYRNRLIIYFLQPKLETLYIVSKDRIGSWLWLTLLTPYCQIQP